jgi:hypothetical protein
MKNQKNILVGVLVIVLIAVVAYASFKEAPIVDQSYEPAVNTAGDFTNYTNARLGFSIKIPKIVKGMSTSTIFDAQSPNATTTSVVVLDDTKSDTIYIGVANDVYGNAYNYARVSDIESLDESRIPGWALHFQKINNDADLLKFAKKFRNPELCVLGADQTFEKMSDQSKIYNIRFLETPKAEATCDNAGYQIRYSPKAGQIVSWSTGQYPHFTLDLLGSTWKIFDTDMINSFSF